MTYFRKKTFCDIDLKQCMLVQTSIIMQAIGSAFIFYVYLRFNWDINFQITIQSINYFLTEVEKEKNIQKVKEERMIVYLRLLQGLLSHITQGSVWKPSLNSEQCETHKSCFVVFQSGM